MERIVLAYSGGLDTSVAIPWLTERYHAEIVALTLDLGQGRELDDVRERALSLGAVRAHVLDVREEFARELIVPALQACAMYEGRYPLNTALSRPLIARHLVDIARIEGAKLIAHGCTAKGNDQVRLEVSVRALDPSIRVIAPAREWGMTRSEEIEYAKQRNIPVPSTADVSYSTDVNLWGRSIECGALEDCWQEPPEDAYVLTRSPAEAPDTPAYVEIEFKQGVPVKINGVELGLVELVQSLQTIAGAHGVGRIDMVENRLVGIKSREIYEAPAAVTLHTAHTELQKFVIPRDLERLTAELGVKYADLIYNGLWFTQTREAIDALVLKVQERVTGTVRLKLFKGSCGVVGRQSPYALYDRALATHEQDDCFDHGAAEGFVKILGLPVELGARKARVTAPRASAGAGRKL
jgi:argininosuccinate synthase